MIKKIIVMIGMLFLITGCTVNYNLDLNTKSENVSFLEKNNVLAPSGNLNKVIDDWYNTNNDETRPYQFYDKEKIIGDLESGLNFSYKYDNYNEINSYSTFFEYCYDSVRIIDNDNVTSIKASGNFKCFNYLENSDIINVNIVVDGYNADTNADNVIGNTYKWKLKKGSNTDINLTVNKQKSFSIGDIFTDSKTRNISLVVILGIVILVVVVGFIITDKIKHENKI